MRTFRFLSGVVLLLCSSVLAQTSWATEEDLAAAPYPSCALLCLAEFVPTSGCNATDTACTCSNEELTANVEKCVVASCGVYQQLETKNASMTRCSPAPPRNQQSKVLMGGFLPGGIALLFFLARVASLLPKTSRKPAWDDWTMCLMVAFTIPPTIFTINLVSHGLGRDMWTLEAYDITKVLFYYYLGEVFYFSALTLFKVSLLCFLLRIFPTRYLKIGCYIGMAGSVLYGLVFLGITIFQCTPVTMAWDNWDGLHEGECRNIHLQGWLSAAFNLILDVYILVLPLPEVWKLKMNVMKKMMLLFMFSLGIFVTITSVVRLRTLIVFANSHNITWDYIDAAVWSTLELHVGIIVACLPSIRTLFVGMGAKVLASSSGNSKFGSHLNSGFSDGWRTSNRMHLSKPSVNVSIQGDSRSRSNSDYIGLVDVYGQNEKGESCAQSGITVKSGLSIIEERQPGQAL